jgi:argininosuccinate lyase
MTEELFATEKVYELVKKGTSFRDAYRQVTKEQ